MNQILDKVVLQMVFDAQFSSKSKNKIEKTFEDSVEDGTADGIVKGTKEANKKLKSERKREIEKEAKLKAKAEKKARKKEMALSGGSEGIRGGAGIGQMAGGVVSRGMGGFGIAAAIAASIAAVIAVPLKKAAEAQANVEEQLNRADKLATTAAQAGMDQKSFLKLQELMEFSDVDPEAASQAIVEFSKRLGDFKATGANKESFNKLGITKDMSEEEAFLRAVSATQSAQGSEKNNLADKLFGGFGTAQMAEFLSGSLDEQKKKIESIDFDALDRQITKGSQEQSKLTQAYTDARLKELMMTPMDAEPRVMSIEGETQRKIDTSITGNTKELSASLNEVTNAGNKVTNMFTNMYQSYREFSNSIYNQTDSSQQQINAEKNQMLD